MITAFIGSKGGVGTTVTTMTTGKSAKMAGHQVLLVDLTGDIGVVLGCHDELPGVAELTSSGATSRAAVMSTAIDVGSGMMLLPRGNGEIDRKELSELWDSISNLPNTVSVVDAGRGEEALSMVSEDHIRRAVMTECDYQSLHRTRALLESPIAEIDDMIVLGHPDRALGLADIEPAAGRRATTYIERNRSVSRWADAGLLLDRAASVKGQEELWDAGPFKLDPHNSAHQSMVERRMHVDDPCSASSAESNRCGATVKSTQMPCLLAAGHRGNHRSVL